MEAEKIEFKDFEKSISTEEFIAVLEIMKAIHNNFEKALVDRSDRAQKSVENLETLEKTHGKYSQKLMDARKIHKGLESVINKDISNGFSVYLQNYDGIVEFLTRFGKIGSVRTYDITPFIKKHIGKSTV